MSAISAVWLYVGWGAVHFETNYGLMQHSPSEIKEKLLKALDKEYNVVDMAAVVEIVSILERTPITKEALETTRLGRYINELRRKTTNESLAKRAKDLVRRWRDMILPQTEAAAPPQHNGSGSTTPRPGRAGSRACTISPTSSNTSPALSSKADAVPKTHASNKRLRKEDSPDLLPSKIAKLNGASFRPELGECSRDGFSDRGSDGCEIVNVVVQNEPIITNVTANESKKKVRQKGSKNRSKLDRNKSDKRGEDIVKEKIASIARKPRVKTTQELVADLRSRSGEDSELGLVNCVLPSNDEMTRNKTEHIAKFLRSQSELEADNSVELINPTQEELRPLDSSLLPAHISKEPPIHSPPLQPHIPSAAPTPEVTSTSVPQEDGIERTLQELYSRLPPIDPDSIVWDDSQSPPVSPEPVREITEDDVDRLHNEHIENLNGNFDHAPSEDGNNFREWHEMVSRTSYNGELFDILPYVVID
ncbi:uncharacterized protein LOC142329191 [Lycorma delicatula]|uniref:uncharacterized protein LOC142329191 n=1 Tax=Lycorma delicatula TaxID=130591 RepID=UPI003F5184BA